MKKIIKQPQPILFVLDVLWPSLAALNTKDKEAAWALACLFDG